MAGYIMTLDSEASLQNCIKSGIYATNLSITKSYWNHPQEGTLADYVTMKEGDNIYFFIDRKIYGIGELVNIGNDCKFLNFPSANKPGPAAYDKIRNQLLYDGGEISSSQRWICVFKPNPRFFRLGIDTDEMLSSNPSRFRMLRVIWKVSFIKMDDDENQAFKDAILKANEVYIAPNVFPDSTVVFTTEYERSHKQIERKLLQDNYRLTTKEILNECADEDMLKHEMALEAGLLFQLSAASEYPNTKEIFSEWDYLSHQVVASPFRPIDYMDKMVIFGYAFIKGYSPTRSKYLLIELKKGEASKDNIDQTLKYVDWIKEEYSFNDYSMIKANLVAKNFSDDVKTYAKKVGTRKYTIGKRPAQSKEWSDFSLVKYSFDPSTQSLVFSRV